MKNSTAIFCMGLLAFASTARAQDEISGGSLYIIGGGLKADTAEIWSDFATSVTLSGPIVIVPSASGRPMQSADRVRATLMNYGVSDDRIKTAPLALRDDPSTEQVDESLWAENTDNPDVIDLLNAASAFWFTGGDQARTTQLLLKDGEDTSALSAIRKRSSAGAPLGGTSAGAAIMSEQMILQGDSLGALIGASSGERLDVGSGLGFFETGLIDQHFGERARLGRLASALFEVEESNNRIGFGIDENTALIANHDGTARIAGSGYVTIIDARNAARESYSEGQVSLSNLTLHLASAGDEIDLKTLAIKPAAWKTSTVGQEYVSMKRPAGGGMAVRGQMLQDVIGEGLIDNAKSTEIERISFGNSDQAILYRFAQSPESSGYWGRGSSGSGRYTIKDIKFDIRPLRIRFEDIIE